MQRVPATSVSPTYKLTLPSEYVYGALSHLVDKDFQLVSTDREQAWSVAILPRKNKDKYEYTLQASSLPFAASSLSKQCPRKGVSCTTDACVRSGAACGRGGERLPKSRA